ncbi:NrfJ [Paraferrimonas haliotis]|uniref:NrfJ n=1 Tax=Paraferrimonas haliotis TaxID=2013866 RepID=A0AA37TS99_9GAMM|nr:NrfJ [Paraferrimonas haliotis]GLS83596.1 hypothetical protein GCM10007894_15730 [Paraferrimonas haliotis]
MIRKILASFLAVFLFTSATSAWAQPGQHTGEVVQTMNSGGYTYVEVKENDKTFWLAAPQTSVEKGETITVSEQMWMTNFTSRSLNKTFDKILFVGEIQKTSK